MVTALAAVRAKVVAVVDMREAGGFEFGVFHRNTVAVSACAYIHGLTRTVLGDRQHTVWTGALRSNSPDGNQ